MLMFLTGFMVGAGVAWFMLAFVLYLQHGLKEPAKPLSVNARRMGFMQGGQ